MMGKHTAKPKDVAGLEGAVREVMGSFRRVHAGTISVGDIGGDIDTIVESLVAAMRTFCDPETLRQRDALLAVVKWFMEKLDDGTLIRNISKDGESDFHLRMMKFTQGLQRAVKLIVDCEATKD